MTKIQATIAVACELLITRAAAPQPSRTISQVAPTANGAWAPPPAGETTYFDPHVYLSRGSGVKLGRALSTPDPEYSESARRAKINGTVFLAVAINADGTVDAVKVVRSVEPGLDQNAVDAVKQWKFTPATKDGKAVAVQIELTIEFKFN